MLKVQVAVSTKWPSRFAGVLIIRGILFRVYTRAPDFGNSQVTSSLKEHAFLVEAQVYPGAATTAVTWKLA